MPPFYESLRDALLDKILLVLFIFALLSILTGMIYSPSNGWIEGTSIIIVVVILVLILSLIHI